MSVNSDIKQGKLVVTLNQYNKPEYYRKLKNNRWYRVGGKNSRKPVKRIKERDLQRKIEQTRLRISKNEQSAISNIFSILRLNASLSKKISMIYYYVKILIKR